MKPALGLLIVLGVGIGAIAIGKAKASPGGGGYDDEKENCIDTVSRGLQNIMQDNRQNPAALEIAAVQLTNLGLPEAAQCVREYARGTEGDCSERFKTSIRNALANGTTPALKANQQFFYDWLKNTGHAIPADCFALLTGMKV